MGGEGCGVVCGGGAGAGGCDGGGCSSGGLMRCAMEERKRGEGEWRGMFVCEWRRGRRRFRGVRGGGTYKRLGGCGRCDDDDFLSQLFFWRREFGVGVWVGFFFFVFGEEGGRSCCGDGAVGRVDGEVLADHVFGLEVLVFIFGFVVEREGGDTGGVVAGYGGVDGGGLERGRIGDEGEAADAVFVGAVVAEGRGEGVVESTEVAGVGGHGFFFAQKETKNGAG